jgi:glycosyltransferase involved in cell wall biosynthesis
MIWATICGCLARTPLCRSLHENQTGLLFPPRDAKALAETILRLVSDLDCRVRIGTAGAREVREKWLWHRIVEKMRRVYEELIPVARDIAILPQAANLHALATAA